MAAAASRRTEVTKLITVTLGKIQESKQAKCGLNLRKSLLVASVLHKARDVYVTEVKNRPSAVVAESAKRREDSSSSIVPAKVKRRFASQRSMSLVDIKETSEHCSPENLTHSNACSDDIHTELESQSRLVSKHSDDEQSSDIRISPPKFATMMSVRTVSNDTEDILQELADKSEEYTTTTDKENSPPSDQQTTSINDESLSSSCGRCLKRRSSSQNDFDNELDNNSNRESFNSPVSTYVPKKRMRTTSIDNSSDIESSPTYHTDSNVMDTTQMNSLVRIFSQSFSDFTSSQVSDATSGYEKSTELNTFALCRDSIALTLAA